MNRAGRDAEPGMPPSQRGGRVTHEAMRFRVVRIEEPLAGGGLLPRDVIEHAGSVVIVPRLADGRVCLVANRRVAIGETLLELPAGTLDRDEPLAEAARRELAEETGYRAGSISHVGGLWMSPGILRERTHLFLAEDLEDGPQALEPGETIERRLTAWSEAVAMCLDGRIDDAKTVAAILMLQCRRILPAAE
jgi:ADP-ribose pyrophosphatase